MSLRRLSLISADKLVAQLLMIRLCLELSEDLIYPKLVWCKRYGGSRNSREHILMWPWTKITESDVAIIQEELRRAGFLVVKQSSEQE